MAISVSDSVVIARPDPEVFAYVVDHENLATRSPASSRARLRGDHDLAPVRVLRAVLVRIRRRRDARLDERRRRAPRRLPAPHTDMAAGVRRQVKADHRRLKTVLEHP